MCVEVFKGWLLRVSFKNVKGLIDKSSLQNKYPQILRVASKCWGVLPIKMFLLFCRFADVHNKVRSKFMLCHSLKKVGLS